MRKFKDGKTTEYRFNWGSFYTGWHKVECCLNRAWGEDCDDGSYDCLVLSIGWGCLYIHIPSKYERTSEHNWESPSYGFYFTNYNGGGKHFDALWICRGFKNTVIEMPWSLKWYRSSYLLNNYKWYHEFHGDRKRWLKKNKGKSPADYNHKVSIPRWDNPDTWQDIFNYTYVLKDGTVQSRLATVCIEEREWRRKWLMWCPLFNHTKRTLEIDFDDEVGEETGTWKGGVMGCGYEMKRKALGVWETPEECLRRMERERKFD